MRGSHNMAIERVLVAIKGGKQRRKKNKGWGGRVNTSWRSMGLSLPHVVVIERFSIATCRW